MSPSEIMARLRVAAVLLSMGLLSACTGPAAQPTATPIVHGATLPPAAPAPTHPAAAAIEETSQVNLDDRHAIKPLGLFGEQDDPASPRTSPLDTPDNLRQVTFAGEGSDFDPDIDPKGQWIAFASTRHRATSDIYLQRVGGTAVTQVSHDPGNDVMPAFSPDGKRIAFASDRSGNWDLYLQEIGGGQPIKLTDSPTSDLHPSFSPDGTKLVYCSYGAQSGQWELVVIDLQRPQDRRFLSHGLFPNWSPKGDKIVFQRSRARGTRWFSVWTLDIDAQGNAVRPTEIAASRNAAAITPHWSPDGQYLAFCTVLDPQNQKQERPSQADIWITTADGRGRVNLTNSPFASVQPVWAPDGTIYFVANRAPQGVENIWSIRADRATLALGPAGGADNAAAAVVRKAAAPDESQPINAVRDAAPATAAAQIP